MDYVTTPVSSTPVEPIALPENKEVKPNSRLTALYQRTIQAGASAIADKARIFVPVSALCWLSCAAVNKLFKATSWVTGAAKEGEQSYMYSRQVQELTHNLIDASQTIRDERQSTLQMAQAIPVVGTFVAIAAKEAEAERAVTWWAKRYTAGVFEFLRYSSPYILQGLHAASTTLEKATGTLKVTFYNAMTKPGDHLRNVADKMKAIQYKALHTDIQRPIPTLTFTPVPNKKEITIKREREPVYDTTANKIIATGLSKSAFALEVLMILPYGKQIVASILEQAGVPVYEIEKTFAKLPIAVTEAAVNIEGKALSALRALDEAIAKEPIEHTIEAFSHAVVEECKENSSNFFCSDKVYSILKSKENILAYAKKLELDPASEEFVTAIQELITAPAGWMSWFQQGLQATFDTIRNTRIGKGIGHLGEAAKPLFKSNVDEKLKQWHKSALELTKIRTQSNNDTLSHAAVVELGSIWSAMLERAGANDAFSRFIRDTYMNSVRPTLLRALTTLESAHHINAANANFLSLQMDANLQTELHMQQFLAEKAKLARAMMQDESQGFVSQTLSGVASWGFPILSWLFLSSQTLTVLPFVMQRVVPHLLRKSAETLQTSQKPFWFSIAEGAKKVYNKGALQLKTTTNWFQSALESERKPKTLLSISDYFQLPSDEQDDILFIVSHAGKSEGSPFLEYRALEHTTNTKLRKILEQYTNLDEALLTPSKLRAMSPEKVRHLITIIDTYQPELADQFYQETGIDIYTTHNRLLYPALASLYSKLPPSQQALLLELTETEYAAMPEELRRELSLFVMQHAESASDPVAAFNSLDRTLQAEFRETNALASLQREAIITSIEKELAEVSLKLKALQRRIKRLSDGEYLATKEQVAETKRELEKAIKDKASSYEAHESMKEAEAPVKTLQKLLHLHTAADKKIPLLQKQLESDSLKFNAASNKLSHLHELEAEYMQKLTSLNSLLGSTLSPTEEIEESPKLTQAIDETLKKTLDEVGQSVIESLVAVARKDSQALGFSREFLDEAITLRKKHLSSVEARIKSLKSELEHLKKQGAYEAIAEKRLQLRAHTNFTLKLHQALLAKFIELRKDFERHIKKAPIAATAAAAA